MNAQERERLAAMIREYHFAMEMAEIATSAVRDNVRASRSPIILAAEKQLDKAERCIAEVEPAWNILSFDEQAILREFYGLGTRHDGAQRRLCARLHLSPRQIYRLSSRALQKFADAMNKA